MSNYTGNPEIMKKLWQNPEYRKRMSEAHKGYRQSKESILKRVIKNTGKKRSDVSKLKISLALMGRKSPSGSEHYKWKVDRSTLAKKQERNDSAYQNWRKQIWIRDNFKCKINNQDCLGRLEAHHILGWSSYPELRYIINNGITLCHAHHPKKRVEEQELAPVFQELIKV